MDTVDSAKSDPWVEAQLASLEGPAGWTPDAHRGLAAFRVRRGVRRRTGARWVAGVIAATVLSLFLPGTRILATRCVDACVDVTRSVGEWLKPTREVRVASAHGLVLSSARGPASDFTLADAGGTPVRLSALQGRVVLLNFWATWCGPCKVEIPWFSDLQSRYGAQGLTVIGVSLDEDGWTSVRPFAQQLDIRYPLVLGTDDVARGFGGIDALPATFLIDRSGRIAARHVGLVSVARYEQEIAQLLAEGSPRR